MTRRLTALPLAVLGMLATASTALGAGPSAIGTGSDGTSYVGFPASGGIQRIAVDGSTTALPAWGTPGTGEGQLGGIVAVGVAPGSDGHVFVLDTNRRVQEFTKTGTFVKGTQLSACTNGTPDATKYGGLDVRVDGAGTTPVALYVAHPCANQVLKLDPASATLAVTQTATTTSRPGRVTSPRYLTGPSNTRSVYVALPDAKAVASFQPTTLAAGPDTTRTYDFTPSDVFIDEFGVLAVGDVTNNKIHLYDSAASEFRALGSTGSAAGQLSGPQAFDIAGQDGTEKAGNLFIADSGNERVQRWNPFGFTFWTAAATGTGGGTPPTGQAPTNSAAPSISGSAAVGQTLTCNPGTWTGGPTYAYSWRRDGAEVGTGATYALVAADAGKAITCRVTGTNGSGSATATSAAVTPTAAPSTGAPVAGAVPTIAGDRNPGAVLVCSDGTFSNSPTRYEKRWIRGGTVVGTGDRYGVSGADVGTPLVCEVTAFNASGSAVSTSAPVTATWNAPVNTGAPTIQGTPQVGQALTCTRGDWAWFPTTYVYSWRRDGSAIAGGETYTPVAADAGRAITCAVTASNPAGAATAQSTAVTPTTTTTPPTGTRVGITINSGAEATNTAAVSLTIREPAGATGVEISNDGSFDAPSQRQLAANDTYSWTLDARGSQRRARVVYVRFVGPSATIDANQTYSDDILLDTTAPTVTTATINSRTASRTATARVAASDSGSGVARIQYAGRKSAAKAKTLKLKKSRSFKVKPSGAKWVRAIDLAGNASKWKRVSYKAPAAKR